MLTLLPLEGTSYSCDPRVSVTHHQIKIVFLGDVSVRTSSRSSRDTKRQTDVATVPIYIYIYVHEQIDVL